MTTNGDEHYRDPYHSALPPSNNCADLTEEILEAGDNQYPIPYIGTPEAPNIFHAQGDTPAISFRYGLLYVLCAGVPGAVRGEYPFLISLTCQLIAAGCFYWVGRKHTRTAWIAAALITVAGCLWLVVMGSKAFRVRACYIVTFSWVLMLAVCVAGEPDREKGLSVHMLPDRVAQINGGAGGFTVRAVGGTESTYSDAIQLVAFFQTLPSSTQENGIWVVTTHPSAYSENERTKLKTLIALCGEKKIPVFTCRGSELPNGWKRSDVPTGWNDATSTH